MKASSRLLKSSLSRLWDETHAGFFTMYSTYSWKTHKKSGELTEKGLPNTTCFRHRLHASHIAVDLLQRLSGVGHRQVSVHDKPQPTGSLVVMEAVLACLKGQEAVLPAVRQAAKDNRHSHILPAPYDCTLMHKLWACILKGQVALAAVTTKLDR